MSDRSDAANPSASREDRETLLEIARQMNGAGENAYRNGAASDVARNTPPEAGTGGGPPAEPSFESAPAGLALYANGEITRVNASFALAFGYPTADALLAAGGLAAIFPKDAAALAESAGTNGKPETAVFDALTRSRRQVKIPVAVHEISRQTGEPLRLLVLHPDSAKVDIGAIVFSAETQADAKAGKSQPRGNGNQSVIVEAVETVEPAPPAGVEDDTRPAEESAEQISAKAKRRRSSGKEFLARVSHDIRTPLNSIVGFAQLMKEERLGPLGGDRYRGYVRDIIESGEYALDLISDLLDISKVETGDYELNFTSVDLNELAGECMRAIQPQAHKARVFLRAALDDDLPLVLADRPSLKQILLNLLCNAVTFTTPGGQVVMESRLKPSGAVGLRVQDNGTGMSETEIAQAMQPFRQQDTAPRLRYGTGLALPLTKALAKANRAKFRLASFAATGTKVSIIFPADRTVRR